MFIFDRGREKYSRSEQCERLFGCIPQSRVSEIGGTKDLRTITEEWQSIARRKGPKLKAMFQSDIDRPYAPHRQQHADVWISDTEIEVRQSYGMIVGPIS